MANELGFQADLRKAAVEAGGHAVKLTNRFTIGVPDLAFWLWPFVPCIIEAKEDDPAPSGKFNRQVQTTPKQRDFMRRTINAYSGEVRIAAVVIKIKVAGEERAYCLPWDATRYGHEAPHVVRKRGARWDVDAILRKCGVPLLGFFDHV